MCNIFHGNRTHAEINERTVVGRGGKESASYVLCVTPDLRYDYLYVRIPGTGMSILKMQDLRCFVIPCVIFNRSRVTRNDDGDARNK